MVAHPGSSTTEAPDRLFAEHLTWARELSRRLAGRCGVRADDAEADALLGLWDAAARFSPGRGKPFTAYARKRIRGAILDGRRELKPRIRKARPRTDSLDLPLG